jgi:hypothetical protein
MVDKVLDCEDVRRTVEVVLRLMLPQHLLVGGLYANSQFLSVVPVVLLRGEFQFVLLNLFVRELVAEGALGEGVDVVEERSVVRLYGDPVVVDYR